MTLKDVAQLSGCSVATVSKALKNSPEISEEAKQRIVSIAKKSGYLKKATTRTAVLGGLKTVIFNDVKGDSADLILSLQRLAKKFGLILIYVCLSVNESKELMNQQGACGLIIKGTEKQISDEKILVFSSDMGETESFLKTISEFKPKRPSRAGKGGEKASSQKEKTEEYIVETLTPPQTEEEEKEEIWLL